MNEIASQPDGAKAWVAAERELSIARTKLEMLGKSGSLAEAEQLWSETLTALQRFVTKLSIGCQGKKLAPFFGEIVNAQRNDPLLAYVKNARDADEHGIELITEREGPGVGIGPRHGSVLHIDFLRFDKGKMTMGPLTAAGARFVFSPAKLILVPVRNRGRVYPVPFSHLGLALGTPSPLAVGKRALAYFEGRLAAARVLEQK